MLDRKPPDMNHDNSSTSWIRFGNRHQHGAFRQRLNVMDSTAFSMCMDNRIPIVVFNLFEYGNIRRAILGEPIGTLVSD